MGHHVAQIVDKVIKISNNKMGIAFTHQDRNKTSVSNTDPRVGQFVSFTLVVVVVVGVVVVTINSMQQRS
jgi:hypothetical protein